MTIIEDVLDEVERKNLLKWIFSNKHFFQKNKVSYNRYFFDLDEKNKKIPKLFFELKNRIIKKQNIKIYEHENLYFGDLISFIENEGKIQRHVDPTVLDYNHVRYIVFLSLPEFGGKPIYNNKIINVSEGQCLKYYANLYFHECEKVIGDRPRIVISYGFFLPRNEKKNENLKYA